MVLRVRYKSRRLFFKFKQMYLLIFIISIKLTVIIIQISMLENTVNEFTPKSKKPVELQHKKSALTKKSPQQDPQNSKSKHTGMTPVQKKDTPRQNTKTDPNPKDQTVNPQQNDQSNCNRKKKIIIAIAIFLVLSGVIAVIVVAISIAKSKSTKLQWKDQTNRLKQTSGQYSEVKTLAITNQQKFGAGKELLLQITTTSSPNGRLLQQSQQTIGLQVRDQFTGTTVKYSSASKQVEVGVAINQAIQYVFNNQPAVDIPDDSVRPNLKTADGTPVIESSTDNAPSSFNITYFQIHQQIQKQLKEQLVKAGANNVQSSVAAYKDAKLDTNTDTYQLIEQVPLQSTDPNNPNPGSPLNPKAPVLVDPASTPVVNNIYDQAQIAKAAAKVIVDVVNRIQAIVNDNKEAIETATNLKLSSTDNTQASKDTSTSTNTFQQCIVLSGDTVRCSADTWNSGKLKLSNPDKPVEVQQLIVRLDA